MNNSNIDLNFSKDADITEVLGMDQRLKDIEKELSLNISQTQINYNRKLVEIKSFLKNHYNSRLTLIKQNTISDVFVRK